ncbi:methylenetetrahydrofolate reductase [Microbacterium sp. Leaf288]|uniref:methylenetetrahydrofolate reductase n=1 Tax=Microbacterium sp. Leaf288 TaxID=1736323 RepID=UPI001F2DDDAE|nr:methylenetetrahydrofolate reductase [Microbacterium sp. Leaf288]
MTGADVPALLAARDLIPANTLVNITFLSNETSEARVEAARTVIECGLTPVPHIAARRLRSTNELNEILAALQEVGATERLFLIGGDPASAIGPFDSSADIIESGVLSSFGVKQVGIAGYPEGHPAIPQDALWLALLHKSQLLREQGLEPNVVTQFAFDVEPVVKWIGLARQKGLEAGIRIGTPGPAGVKRLLSFARRFGVASNATIVRKYGFSLSNLLGNAGPDRFVSDLAARLQTELPSEQVKLHFYAFGGLGATASWAKQFVAEDASEERS